MRARIYNFIRRLFLLNFWFIFNNRLAKVNAKITTEILLWKSGRR